MKATALTQHSINKKKKRIGAIRWRAFRLQIRYSPESIQGTVALMAHRTLIWAVNVYWYSDNGYWNVNANSVENPNRWNADNQVLSRYYFLLGHKFEDIVSVENILEAWQEFIRGKRNKRDVQEFSLRLMNNIFNLHCDLVNHTYKHGGYQTFNICDPKPRNIHKASVRDRLVHHAVYRIFYPFFNRTFISDSFSCRLGKGTHRAINRFRSFAYKVSENNTRTCWILKCDIRKFFANIDHEIVIKILEEYIPDKKIIGFIKEVINSFYSVRPGIGLPLGNLTSQLFVNIYMNEFDQFVKHKLKTRYYIRYSDDFVIFSQNRQWLKEIIPIVQDFLENRLKLKLHPNKISIKTLNSGEDFLGWVNFPDHRILRTTTKRRMFKRIKTSPTTETLNSYLGLLKHGNTNKIKKEIFKNILRIESFFEKS